MNTGIVKISDNSLTKKIVAIILIIALTMADFILLGTGIVSYAADMTSTETNNKNVTFDCYFKDENGNTVTNVEKHIDGNELKLFAKVSVKNEGYFNGQVSLGNSNFKLKNEVLSEGINKIEENTVTLNKINAGETVEVELGIEPLKSDAIKLEMLNMSSEILINGIYRDRKEKDINISATRQVNLTLTSPYEANEGIELSSSVLTNKVYKIDGQNKRVVQVLVESGLEGNRYPVKENKIEVSVPEGVQKVEVNSKDTLVTNGKTELKESEWEYIENENKVNIIIANSEENGTIKWLKNGKDKVIVTYIMSEDENIAENDITVKNTITLYDAQTTVKETNQTVAVVEELDGAITYEMDIAEKSIYKGKIYSGEDKNYDVTTNIYYNKAVEGNVAEVNLGNPTYETVNGELIANVDFAKTVINKAEMVKALGENGEIQLISETETVRLTAQTEADENGNIVVNYISGTKTITVKTTEPITSGKIALKTTKVIKEDGNSREVKNTYVSLNEKLNENNYKISLIESTSSVKLEVNKESLSTMIENTSVEMKATLKTSSEENNLFENPTLKIVLPKQVESVNINSTNLVYEDEMQIKDKKVYSENGVLIIEVSLEGKQTKHKATADETMLIIDANLVLNKKEAKSSEAIKLLCNNQSTGENVETDKPIEITTPKGIITINNIEEYGLTTLGEEKEKVSNLQIGTEQKEAKVDIEVINADNETIKNVKVLGEFPTKNSNSNTLEARVSELEIEGAPATVYYTENENATDDINNSSNNWKTNITDSSAVKKYLILADGLERAEEIKASYKLSIPENLQYNEQAYEKYDVNYSNAKTNMLGSASSTTLGLTTGKGPELQVNLKAKVGGTYKNDGDEVAQGEVIKYEINLENTGTEDATNVEVSANVPEGGIYVEPKENYEYEPGYYNEMPDKKDVTFTVESIKAGEKLTKTFEVMIPKNTLAGSQLMSKATVKYGEAIIQSNSVTNKVKEGNLSIIVKRVTDRETELTFDTIVEYRVIVENISDTVQNNVSVDINLPKELELSRVEIADNDDIQEYETTTHVSLGNIPAKEKKYIIVYARVKTGNDENAVNANNTNASIVNANVSVVAKVNNKVEIKSNEIEETLTFYKLNITLSSNNENGYLKTGDEIEYTLKIENTSDVDAKLIDIVDDIPEDLTITKVTLNDVEQEVLDNGLILSSDVPAHSMLEAKINAVVNYDATRMEEKIISNKASLADLGEVIAESGEVANILRGDGNIDPESDEDPTGGETPADKNAISGVAWIDENRNGERDAGEQPLEGINVKLIDTSDNVVKNGNGEEITAVTNGQGLYVLTGIPEGQYMVIFDYDSSIYGITTYQKEGIDSKKNSDAIVKELTIDGQNRRYGVTDIITVGTEPVSGIDIGLVKGSKFDLELNKYISKIIVQNNKDTKVYEYNQATLAKAEISAKELQGTMVLVEYQIEVKNNGELAGYVKSVADYMPSSLKFNSELNKDWYQSGTNLYNSSLSNTKLEAGETKTLTLTLTKTMTAENTGLVNNTAEIAESYNELGIADIDSTPGNKVQQEDDMASADVVIGVKTGAIIAGYISIALIMIFAMGLTGWIVYKKLDKNNEIEIKL